MGTFATKTKLNRRILMYNKKKERTHHFNWEFYERDEAVDWCFCFHKGKFICLVKDHTNEEKREEKNAQQKNLSRKTKLQ